MKQSVLATNIKRLAFLTLLAFCVMPLGVGYWAVLRAQDLKQNPHNRRAEARLERTKPGRVYSREGEEILGRTRDKQGSSWQRTYPSPHTYCHLTGYNHRTGLQLSLRQFLLEPVQWFDPLYVLTDPEPVGNDVMLTIDAGAQALAQRLLQGRKGAIVALNPSTGEVLVLASAPTYNPTEVVRDPEAQTLFTTNPDAPELFRAVQGLYPPGSIFKVMTTAAALERGEVSVDTQYTCTGSITIEGQELKCWKDGGHGTLTLSQALAESCNVYFAHLGQVLGIALMSKYAEESGLFTKPALPLPAGVPQASRLEPRHFDDLAAASYAIGQSDLLITPFAAAQIAAAIANEGQFMSPQLLRAVTRPDGQIIQHFDPRPGERAFRRSTAQLLAGMMEQAVETGTGQAAQLPGIRVAGKTGSAETSGGAAHAWFIGFAPVQQPRVAVAVIIEHEGTGGGVAAPIAREIMQELLY